MVIWYEIQGRCRVCCAGRGAEHAIQRGTRVLISLWDSLMLGRVQGARVGRAGRGAEVASSGSRLSSSTVMSAGEVGWQWAYLQAHSTLRYPFAWGKGSTQRVLEYARLAMGFGNVGASRYAIRPCSGGYSGAFTHARMLEFETAPRM